MLDASVQGYPMVYVNPAFTEMSGYQPEETIGKGFLVLFGKGTAPEALRLIQSALEDQEELDITLLSYRKNGSTFWKKLTITPVYDGRGDCTHYIAAQQDITRQLKSEELLDYQACHDPVTGLQNHQLFEAHLNQAFARARGKPSDMVLLYVDLDDFKSLNESLGRQVGDLLLAVVADRLRNLLANDDELTRLAADEFVVMRPALKTEAKLQGGNTFCWNHGAASTSGAEQVIMRRELMEAIEDRQFVVHYQPLLDAKTGRLRSAEALVRWNHPARGLLLPGAFISLAEQTGQIVAIGHWPLAAGCCIKRVWTWPNVGARRARRYRLRLIFRPYSFVGQSSSKTCLPCLKPVGYRRNCWSWK